MIPGDIDTDDSSGFSSMEKFAIQEIGNIMTSNYTLRPDWFNIFIWIMIGLDERKSLACSHALA